MEGRWESSDGTTMTSQHRGTVTTLKCIFRGFEMILSKAHGHQASRSHLWAHDSGCDFSSSLRQGRGMALAMGIQVNASHVRSSEEEEPADRPG